MVAVDPAFFAAAVVAPPAVYWSGCCCCLEAGFRSANGAFLLAPNLLLFKKLRPCLFMVMEFFMAAECALLTSFAVLWKVLLSSEMEPAALAGVVVFAFTFLVAGGGIDAEETLAAATFLSSSCSLMEDDCFFNFVLDPLHPKRPRGATVEFFFGSTTARSKGRGDTSTARSAITNAGTDTELLEVFEDAVAAALDTEGCSGVIGVEGDVD